MKKNINVDVVVIGGGPSGYSSAFRCADLGLSVVIIEKYGVLGGTCLNVGCIPSKSLLHLATLIKETKSFLQYDIELLNVNKINMNNIMKWKNDIIISLSNGLNYLAKKRNVDIIHGVASFIDINTVEVVCKDIHYIIYFNYAILAVGSKPVQIPNIPYGDARIWSSTHALNSINIPKRLLIIGAGIIGLEMATIYSALGSQIDIIDNSLEFFPGIDSDIRDIFIKYTKKDFMINMNTIINKIESLENGIMVTLQNNNKTTDKILYDNILIATGRIPNIDSINLQDINIKLNEFGFINVDLQLRTNISHIFAVGDVVGKPMLAHKGIYEAHIAAEVIAGKDHYFDPKVIPCVAYCDPEIAWTGILSKKAKELKIPCRIISIPWNFSGRAISSNCAAFGMTKLLIHEENKKIIGGIIIGRHAGELITQISLAIEMSCDIEDVALTIYPHPTLSESINIAAQVFNKTATDILNI
ncbi:pyruvate and 2-oxoglutarate dehydrogenase E3 component (dihydrolipoamide dehydrogenase) [Buchnera aphidicola (Cinara tujafilina)]|uniref:Dihydrolipoyl dehydrogenase n=1 Tax=Buchnera aphidicola (Cinara tujafilina) TaxID=261317 RepID=F7WZ72_9GAMM|nr:dihydrolipoyl dehydrogenase [Buchnera aphidicola]AEH39726.1 pyruvate and 2-oxoglutarate dehydrogenase E3 component (dihydrolipoamide dehydrogenase) [Buchnera aphidicola (Cinara tujafilina)]